ncbi:MAG: 30S ribosomal protein S6 [Candidatus Delongbacteria bacterium]|jgi:small subunit ribosomal protein S6|nr:30S ribosomal protein S6 [Candidatus Delongbacteria bacterium]MDD4205744.1 30S ribosomal protein S6 [Candidatus Delongbacteria bacterium]MDY0018311.1 30S ribosomal protein S6 [Candidatus Delongbacteria bacterium]
MKRYETVLIIDPTLDQDKIDTVISRYEEMIKSDGEITAVDQWGKKRLAYPINKKPTGFYVLFKYNAGNKIPQKLVDDMNLNSSVIRYMTTVVDKKAMKQEELDRTGAAKAEAAKEEAAAAATTGEEN